MASRARTLLVSAEDCGDVEERLAAAGCSVIKAAGGREAVSQTRHGVFDAAIIVSTGREMGLAETVLNLRDIRHAMPIIIVANREAIGEGELLAGSVPNTTLVAAQGLGSLIESVKGKQSHGGLHRGGR